jgi:phosphoserine phosphatase RsbX
VDAGILRQDPVIDWAVAAKAYPGETRSGDHHVVAPYPRGALVAVIDGLGHGGDAADAAEAAAGVLADHPTDSLVSIVRRCHDELRTTRGAAMSLVSFSGSDPGAGPGSGTGTGTMSWLGVGNVEGALVRHDRTARPRRESLLLRGGVVGYRIPNLLASVIAVEPGDVLVLATDGVSPSALSDLPTGCPPQELAHDLLHRFGLGTDDALVLVATYTGAAA